MPTNPDHQLTHRLATSDDVTDLRALMARSMQEFLPQFLSPKQVTASYEIMGVDTRLVQDGTYFMVFVDGELAGCGGWSRRETLFGGDHSTGRNPRLLDPGHEPARVRAMYTDPSHARQGVGRRILSLCEQAALAEGFSRMELAGTMAGIPLYKACGYRVIREWDEITSDGTKVPLALMSRCL